MEDRLWTLFWDTGDPLCWLLYLTAKQERSGNTAEDRPEELPAKETQNTA